MTQLSKALEGLLRAEAAFEDGLTALASRPPADSKDKKVQRLVDLYDQYIPSQDVRAIAMLLHEFRSYGAVTAEAVRGLIETHNQRMQSLIDDTEYWKRKRIPPDRFREAIFSDSAVMNAMNNATHFGRGEVSAFDASFIRRLLVEFVKKDHAHEALELLASLGFFRTEKGNYNSTVYISTGKLEDTFATFLTTLVTNLSNIS